MACIGFPPFFQGKKGFKKTTEIRNALVNELKTVGTFHLFDKNVIDNMSTDEIRLKIAELREKLGSMQ